MFIPIKIFIRIMYMNINNTEAKKYFIEKFLRQNYIPPKYQPDDDSDAITEVTDVTDITDAEFDDVDDNDIYTINNKKYFYAIENDFRLDFSRILQESYQETYSVHLVLFRINGSLQTPFLEFFLMDNNKQLAFLQFQVKRTEFENAEQEHPEEHPQTTRFKSIVAEEVIQQIGIDLNDKKYDFQQMYKGFYDKNGDYYAFIHIDYFENLDDYGYWGIYHEIHKIQEINEKLIAKSSVDLFNNKNLHILKSMDGKAVPTPICGYIMKKNEKGGFVNVSTEETLFEKAFQFDEFEDVYVFSKNPIDSGSFKKYAIILDDVMYYNKVSGFKKANQEEFKSVHFESDTGVFYLLQYYEHFTEL